jgi:hypothetical protein
MRTASAIARYLAGVIFLVFGLYRVPLVLMESFG